MYLHAKKGVFEISHNISNDLQSRMMKHAVIMSFRPEWDFSVASCFTEAFNDAYYFFPSQFQEAEFPRTKEINMKRRTSETTKKTHWRGVISHPCSFHVGFKDRMWNLLFGPKNDATLHCFQREAVGVCSHTKCGLWKMARSGVLKNQLILALIWGHFVLLSLSFFPFEASSNKLTVTVSRYFYVMPEGHYFTDILQFFFYTEAGNCSIGSQCAPSCVGLRGYAPRRSAATQNIFLMTVEARWEVLTANRQSDCYTATAQNKAMIKT